MRSGSQDDVRGRQRDGVPGFLPEPRTIGLVAVPVPPSPPLDGHVAGWATLIGRSSIAHAPVRPNSTHGGKTSPGPTHRPRGPIPQVGSLPGSAPSRIAISSYLRIQPHPEDIRAWIRTAPPATRNDS